MWFLHRHEGAYTRTENDFFSFLTAKRHLPLFCAIVLLSAIPHAVRAETVIAGGALSADTVWTKAESPYVIIDSLDIPSDVLLSIEPGVIVKFDSSTSLNIDGSLSVAGTLAEPVFFTSLRNDAVGGDTNGDGTATTPSEFDRWSVDFYAGSTGTISYADISFADDVSFADSANLLMEHLTVHDSNDGFYLYQSALSLSDTFAQNLYGSFLTADQSTLALERVSIDTVLSDSIGGYSGSDITLREVSITNTGWGNPIGLYESAATGTKVILDGGFSDGIGLYGSHSGEPSTLHLTDSAIKNFADSGMFSTRANFTISKTLLTQNAEGIYSQNAGVVSQSSFIDNILYGIYNSSTDPLQTIDARQNFWGDASGPASPGNLFGFGDTISDNVLFDPWLETDPLLPTCCSSIAFIPGLEASRLYRQSTVFEDKLWEPNRNSDVQQLMLSTTTGESIDPSMYTRDVLDEPLGLSISGNIYKGFLERMRELVEGGVVNAFEPLPYDWRFDVRDVVTSNIHLPNNASYRMTDRIEALAEASQTGKVTLITHSNGGLVAKELLSELVRLGKDNLVDRVIMVAAPELGTPEAMLQLLHGTAFFLGLPSRTVTRELGENMKSAYALLPSREYFSRLGAPAIRPLIEFATTTTATETFRDTYGDAISDYDSLRTFLLGENGSRTEPLANAVDVPNVLKEHFLSNAEAYHDTADVWTPPPHIGVIEIVGWGLATPYGINYTATQKRKCNANGSACLMTDILDPEPLETFEGDATVVAPSAEAFGGERYYVDINHYNKSFAGLTINRSHKNILEIEPLQDLIATLMQHESTTTLPDFISSTTPKITDTDKRLRLSVHSPVSLHLYDALGRHTGPIPNADPNSDLELYEEQIPNSYYWRLGEGQYAGAGGDTPLSITLKGTALGTFTAHIEELSGGAVATTTVYEDIPVATTTTATLVAGGGTVPALSLDIDGDGTVDTTITPGGLTAEELIHMVKGLIKTFNLPPKREKLLLRQLDKLEKELQKEHKKERMEKLQTKFAFTKIIHLISRYEKRKLLTKEETAELITMLENIRSMVVK